MKLLPIQEVWYDNCIKMMLAMRFLPFYIIGGKDWTNIAKSFQDH